VSHPFRAAVEAGDSEGAIALLAPDVVFRSPVVHRPYEGADAVAGLLRAVFEVFEDFRYVDELESAGGGHALIFEARVGDRQLQGMDLLYGDADGRIGRFTVMVRPLSGALALAEAMKARLAA
jgi:hypothetical protein